MKSQATEQEAFNGEMPKKSQKGYVNSQLVTLSTLGDVIIQLHDFTFCAATSRQSAGITFPADSPAHPAEKYRAISIREKGELA